ARRHVARLLGQHLDPAAGGRGLGRYQGDRRREAHRGRVHRAGREREEAGDGLLDAAVEKDRTPIKGSLMPAFTPTVDALARLLEERVLVLDGAMGTMIQRYTLTEADFRGDL